MYYLNFFRCLFRWLYWILLLWSFLASLYVPLLDIGLRSLFWVFYPHLNVVARKMNGHG